MHVLLPIKNLNFAKQRLASLLNAIERRNFFQAMLHDVLEVLDTHPLIDGITLVSDDPDTQTFTKNYQLSCISQASLNVHGLSNTVAAGVSFLANQGIKHVMVLHGDLPLITAKEVRVLINQYATATTPGIILTPDRRATGTNCIICPTQTAFKFQYGDHSFEKHCVQASLCGIKTQVIEQDGMGCDIDYPQDLLQFLTQTSNNNSAHTQKFLRENKIIHRLLQQAIELTPVTQTPHLATLVNLATKQTHKNYVT